MYAPTSEDFELLDQANIILYLSVQIKDEKDNLVDYVHGMITGGTFTVDATADVRRTMSINVVPVYDDGSTIWNGERPNATFDLTEKADLWINKTETFLCGIKNLQTDEIKWYQLGVFYIQDENLTYEATNHSMAINCGDLMTTLNATVNGQLGSLTITIPAYQEDEDGNPISYNIIRDAMVQTLTQKAGIKDYIVDDIGEFNAMKQNNPNHYLEYRQQHPLWNNVPYDLEFSAGCSVYEIITKLRDLYPNYETYFDEYGVFVCDQIPSCYYDTIYLRDDILQKYLISENMQRDLTTVRNEVEVWGQVLDTDFYSEDVANSNNTYTASIEGMEDEYKNGDKIALNVPVTNAANQYININGYGAIPIYDEDTDTPLAAGTLEANNTYVFRYKKKYDSTTKNSHFYFYFMGAYQCHGFAVLSDGTVVHDGWVNEDGKKIDKYSKEYFQQKYNCKNVEVWVIPDSPFTVQKIGERLDVKSGGDYDDIMADSLATARAHYDLWQDARLTDNITLTTLIMPWLDVNTKVTYRLQNSTEIKQYIIKSVSHDFDGAKTTITMMTFYPLYEFNTQ